MIEAVGPNTLERTDLEKRVKNMSEDSIVDITNVLKDLLKMTGIIDMKMTRGTTPIETKGKGSKKIIEGETIA